MFKKTLIAAAVATLASSVAMADVSISGVVEQTFTDTAGTGSAWTGSTDSDLTFKASEDLGNGLTAFAQITLDTDQTDANDTATDSSLTDGKDSKVGISGSFGTIVMGRMEDFTEGKVMSMMTLNGTGAIEATGNTGRNDDAIAYVSPTVNGLHVGVAGYAVTADSDAIDATDMAIFYDNGPLSVKIAQEKNDNAAESLAIGASYAMGDVKVSALHVNRKDDSDSTVDHNDVMLRLDYTMGSNKFTIASLDDEQTTGIDGTDVTAVELTHSFSSRTSAYIGATDSKAANKDTTYVGMIHKF